jgi:hypothetical protein
MQLGEFSFLYSSINSRQMNQAEFFAGQGIACVNLILLDRDGEIVQDVPWESMIGEDIQLWTRLQSSTTDKYLESPFSILVEIWTQGNIALDVIVGFCFALFPC